MLTQSKRNDDFGLSFGKAKNILIILLILSKKVQKGRFVGRGTGTELV